MYLYLSNRLYSARGVHINDFEFEVVCVCECVCAARALLFVADEPQRLARAKHSPRNNYNTEHMRSRATDERTVWGEFNPQTWPGRSIVIYMPVPVVHSRTVWSIVRARYNTLYYIINSELENAPLR